MSYKLEIQRLASRTASVLVLPSWAGFIYAFLHRPHHAGLGGAAEGVPEAGALTSATLFVSLLCFLCALPGLDDDIRSLAAWLFVIACAVPFFGMISLLDPFGAIPLMP